MIKIRTVVAHNNEEIRNIIVNSISILEYVEVVGTATDGIETYNKIVELKPEIVFSEYNYFRTDMIAGKEVEHQRKNYKIISQVSIQ